MSSTADVDLQPTRLTARERREEWAARRDKNEEDMDRFLRAYRAHEPPQPTRPVRSSVAGINGADRQAGKHVDYICFTCKEVKDADRFDGMAVTSRAARVGRILDAYDAVCRACRASERKWQEAHPLYDREVFLFWNRQFSSQEHGAKVRHIPWLLVFNDVLSMYLRQNGRCAVSDVKFALRSEKSGRSMLKPSIDRIDSTKGYTRDNVHIVCAAVNIIKNDMPHREFLLWCSRITAATNKRESSLLAAMEGTDVNC